MSRLNKLIFQFSCKIGGNEDEFEGEATSFINIYCLSFFFLLSFDISNTQIATIDPFEGTILYVCVCCNKLFILFHFNVLNKTLKSVYINCRVDYKMGLYPLHHSSI